MGTKKINTGLVIGKFYPLHLGHSYLIRSAAQKVRELTVVVCDSPRYSIPASLRARWIRETCPPNVKIKVVSDINDDTNSKRWAQYTRKFLGFTPEAVFTSEDYGEAYAKHLGCKHFCVDKARKVVPISGTKIRQNPLGAWEYLEGPVRAHFAKRVCILGAESSGTTTLAQALALHFRTTWVPEFGRLYYEGRMYSRFLRPWKAEDFEYIAHKQNENEDFFARSCNKLLFCDTDSLTTSLWQKAFMNTVSPAVLKLSKGRNHDLYLLTDIDIPYVNDGTRGGRARRRRMHAEFQQLLKDHNKNFVIISGTPRQRLKKSVQLCRALLSGVEAIK